MVANPFRPMIARQRFASPAQTDLIRTSDVVSDENGWRVRVALPGIAPENVQVDVTAHALRVRAAERDASGEVIRYERELHVPEAVDPQQITATCRNGLLELRLPLKESARPRRITVTTAEPKQLNG
jgi:HSP20 family protein